MRKHNRVKRLPRNDHYWVDIDVLGKFLYKYNYHQTARKFRVVNPDESVRSAEFVCKNIYELLIYLNEEYGERKSIPIDRMVTDYYSDDPEDFSNKVTIELMRA